MPIFNSTITGLIKKEFKQLLRDKKMRAILIVMPILQMTLFGYALSTDVRNIRLSVLYLENDPPLQRIYEKALASGWIIPAYSKKLDGFEQIQSNDADAVLIPPAGGLDKAIGRGEGRLQLLLNASNVMRAQSAENYLQAIIKETLEVEYKFSPPAPAIQMDFRILYNPSMRSAVFQIPAVMGMMILMTSLFFTAMAVAREKEVGTFEMLLSSPATPGEILLGKTIPFILMGMSNTPLILGIAVYLFDVPMQGSVLVLLFSFFIFVCAAVAAGILISTLVSNQQQAMMAGFMALFPMQMLSGLMFPVENMPDFMRVLAYINPLTYFIELLRNIMLKGGEETLVLHHLLIISVISLSLMIISFKRFRTTIG